MVTDLRSGVDVDTRLGVGLLGYDARYDGDSHRQELVRHSVVDHGLNHGVAEDNLAAALDGGVVVYHGVDICVEHLLYVAQPLDESDREVGSLGRHGLLFGLRVEGEASCDLGLQKRAELLDVHADVACTDVAHCGPLVEEAREDDVLDEGYDAPYGLD